VGDGRDPDSCGDPVLRGPWTRIGLLALALLSLWVAWDRFQAWDAVSRATFHRAAGGWVLWLGLMVLSGFLFGLAVVLPVELPDRLGPPALLGVVPLLLLAHSLILISFSSWHLPAPLGTVRFYAGSFPVQFALATMLGMALASGFRSVTDSHAGSRGT
jgi:hypothetical protein